MKQFKNLATIIMGLWCCVAVDAHDFEADGVYYNITYEGDLEVTYKGESYDPYNDSYNEYIGEVNIPEKVEFESKVYSVTSIGNYAFSGCSNLTSVTIPSSVTSIGTDAFRDCTGLASVTIPSSVTSIKYGTFMGCTGLTSITIPGSVKSIDYKAFEGCSSLTDVTIASSEPPALKENSFNKTSYILTTIYVPQGSLITYQVADLWEKFRNIKEFDLVGIEEVVPDSESLDAPIFNLQGIQMEGADNLPGGIYIQGGKKFMVK